MQFLENTNWSLLKKQKETLVELGGAQTALSAEAKADLAGLLHFLDAVMDDAAEVLGEQVVFPGLGEEEECVAVELTSVWMRDADQPRRKLIRHALRSLVKQGHVGALEVLGVARDHGEAGLESRGGEQRVDDRQAGAAAFNPTLVPERTTAGSPRDQAGR